LRALRKRAIRIAKHLQGPRQKGCGGDPWALPVNKGMGAVNLRAVVIESLLEVIRSQNEVSHPEERTPQKMCLDDRRRSARTREGKATVAKSPARNEETRGPS